MTPREVFGSAFTIGRDHLSATIHTLVLAYAGTVLLVSAVRTGPAAALAMSDLAEPIVAALVGCAALILAVPLTTALSAALVARLPVSVLAGAHHHH